ncbi:MAG: hypothetical protein U0414_27240 [Polyangiaceae bacterium]
MNAASRACAPSDLVQLLAGSLGAEKASAVVDTAMKALGISGDTLELGAAKRVLTFVANIDGIVGVTGRVALTRLQYGTSASGSVPMVTKPETRPLSLVVSLLAPDLGEDRAARLVEETASILNLPGEVDLDQALTLLERITRMSGVVGVAARFAKTRIHLSW